MCGQHARTDAIDVVVVVHRAGTGANVPIKTNRNEKQKNEPKLPENTSISEAEAEKVAGIRHRDVGIVTFSRSSVAASTTMPVCGLIPLTARYSIG